MEKSPSREANSHSASQEIPFLLFNPSVHYRVHNSPSLVHILSQMHAVLHLGGWFMLLKWILQKQVMKMCTGLKWIRAMLNNVHYHWWGW